MTWTSRPGAFQWFTLSFCFSFVSKCNFHTLFSPSLNVSPVDCDALSHFFFFFWFWGVPCWYLFFFFSLLFDFLPLTIQKLYCVCVCVCVCVQQLILESFWWSCLHHSYKFKNRLLCNLLMGTHWINRKAKKTKTKHVTRLLAETEEGKRVGSQYCSPSTASTLHVSLKINRTLLNICPLWHLDPKAWGRVMKEESDAVNKSLLQP